MSADTPFRSRLLLPRTLPFTDPKERRFYYCYRQSGSIPPYVVAGLTNFWDSTQQNGSESFVLDLIAGQNAAHLNAPTYDATTKLWVYNGTNQRSITAAGITPPASTGPTAGLWTLEGVFSLHSTTPNFSRPLGILGTGGGATISNSTLSATWAVTGATSTTVATLTLDALVHVVAVGRGATLDLYANGVKTVSGLAYTPAALSSQIAFFGDPSGSSQWTNGKAGWMRWYAASALSDSAVAFNYKHAKSVFPTLP